MRTIVTGAAGFVGANLVRALLGAGHETIAVVRPDSDAWRLRALTADIETLPLELADSASVTSAILSVKPDVIFHLAAHGAYSWQQDIARMLAVNVHCTQALLDAATRLGARLVNAGSSSEYGYKDHAPYEDELARPNSYYAVTKLSATHLCQLAADNSGAEAVTLRLYSAYGPWEQPGRLMPELVRAARQGLWPPLVSPDTARDFVWVDDVCDAFLIAATAELTEPGPVFNIASGVQMTLRDVVSTARQVFGTNTEPAWGSMQQRAWDTSTWVGRPEKATRDLQWRASTKLEDGLAAVGEWFDRHPEVEARYS